MKPDVCVVLPAYNEEQDIAAAISSILVQSFQDFEVVVVDDGSTDNTMRVAAAFSDKRLKLISQVNRGIVAALQAGIGATGAPLIARMDADDVCEPQRLAMQVEFMKDHPDHALVGSCCRVVYDDCARVDHLRVPLSAESVRSQLPWRNPFIHSSVLMRRSVLERVGGYRDSFRWEDYDLWCRMLRVANGANLESELLTRLHRRQSPLRASRWSHHLGNMAVQWSAARHGCGKRFYSSAALSAVKCLLGGALERFQ
jgi:glycosyltransferase involved in cell wall biosynthesis